jgi:hypothetical protein
MVGGHVEGPELRRRGKLDWDSMEDLDRAASTPEGRRAARELLSDEANFIDLPNSPLWLGTELVVSETSG